jgi:hypothetical protein
MNVRDDLGRASRATRDDGSPGAMPSITTWPNGSGIVDACMRTSNLAQRAGVLHQRVNSIRSLIPARSAKSWRLRSYPCSPNRGPHTTSPLTSGRSAKASKQTCCPFHGATRPKKPKVSLCGQVPTAVRRSSIPRLALPPREASRYGSGAAGDRDHRAPRVGDEV